MATQLQQTRAGRYIRQTSGYQAFTPESLPPEPAVALDGEVQTLLSAAAGNPDECGVPAPGNHMSCGAF